MDNDCEFLQLIVDTTLLFVCCYNYVFFFNLNVNFVLREKKMCVAEIFELDNKAIESRDS